MSAANYLIRWVPDIVEATADDIARFGPNAAQVRALLNLLPTLNREAQRLGGYTRRNAIMQRPKINGNSAWSSAYDAAVAAADAASRKNQFLSAGADTKDIAFLAANNAAKAEVVADLITPEQYHILTNPLNVGRTFQERIGLMLPDRQGPFTRMANQLSPASPEEVIALERVINNPNMEALLEMLTSPQMAPGQPLARRIKAAETLYRVGRGGKGMS